MDFKEKALDLHKKNKGKFEVRSKIEIKNKEDLALAYSPGVAEPCKKIAEDKKNSYEYTSRGNLIAIVTDGSAVLGMGNIGAEAAMPVMEGKAILFKQFANVNAIPICLGTQDVEEIIKTIKFLEPSFGGINLEDISAPRCFEIEERLKKELEIPVFHDDQHGTAIAVLAGLINALKIVDKKISEIKIVVSGAGAAGMAITKLLLSYGAKKIIVCDSKGVINKKRELEGVKKEIAEIVDTEEDTLQEAIKNADVFIGVSRENVLEGKDVANMNSNAIVFALSNPNPEIMPEIAKKNGAKIITTGRSDYPNQINNVLVFPGIFRGILDYKIKNIDDKFKIKVAEAISNSVENLNEENIVPDVFDKKVVENIVEAIKNF